MPTTDTWYRITNAAPKAGRIEIYDEIGFFGVTAKEFVHDLRALGDVETLDLHIHSGGGDVYDGTAIFNALLQHPASVTAHIDGLAASMASGIAMAADRVIMADNAYFMIHNPATIAMGGEEDMRKAADLMKMTRSILIKNYQRHSHLSADEIGALMDAETWMTADEAKANGFVHEIAASVPIAASVDLARFAKVPGYVAAAFARTQNTTKPEATPVENNEETVVDYEARCQELEAEVANLKAQIANMDGDEDEEEDEPMAASNDDTGVIQNAAPDVVAAEAQKAERDRILQVQDMSYPGVESVIRECVEDGTDRAGAALRIAEFEKTRNSQALAALRNAAPPAVTEQEPAGKVDPMTMDDAALRNHWRANASLKAEHLTADLYVAHVNLKRKNQEAI